MPNRSSVMRYIIQFLVVVTLVGIFLMPAWITWIPKVSWALPVKRVMIVIMASIATVFTVFAILRPNSSSSTKIIGSLVAVVYLIVVYVASIISWPRIK